MLPLTERSGLPDEVASLRPTYPRANWRGHDNFGQLSAFWLDIHASLRAEGGELAAATTGYREGRSDAAGFQRFFVPHLNRFLQHLDGHHQVEDVIYFPKFRALDPSMVAGFDLLEADHRHIHEALLSTATSAQALAVALGSPADAARGPADAYANTSDHLLKLLTRHLADEEDLIVPAMLHYGERRLS